MRRLRRRERGLGDAPRAGSLRAAITPPGRARHDGGRAARDARRRRAAARHDRAPDRGAAPHDGREARAHLRAPARPRRAPAGARRRGRGRGARSPARSRSCGAPTRCAPPPPPPLDEVHGGLVYFASTLHRVVPELYRELEAAVEERYPGEEIAVPPLLTFGSWMGGDRDGNPNVTAAVTAAGARDDARRLPAPARGADRGAGPARVAVGAARRASPTSWATRWRRSPSCFPEEAARALRAQPGGAVPALLLADAPRACARRARATRGGYGAPARAARRPAARPAAAARRGRRSSSPPTQLHDTIRQVEVFGFHFARLDVREHAGAPRRRDRRGPRRRSACTRRTRRWARRSGCALLAREIAERRPLIPADLERVLRRDAGGRRDVPDARRAAARRATPARCSPTSSRAPRSPARPARGAAADEGERARVGRRRGRAAADRAAVRGRASRSTRPPRDDADAARRCRSTAPRCARSATSRR